MYEVDYHDSNVYFRVWNSMYKKISSTLNVGGKEIYENQASQRNDVRYVHVVYSVILKTSEKLKS